MNFVFLSPHFPPNYYQFCKNLNSLGVTLLGLADEPYPLLNPELRDTLTEYYLVDNMHNYQELLRACGFFTYQYGKIDRIDSLNEYWLEFESRLRTDFNIPGVKEDEIMDIKRKSLMKKKFIKAGVPVAEGRLVKNLMDAKRLIKDIGLPVVAKPDIGVGAAKNTKSTLHFN